MNNSVPEPNKADVELREKILKQANVKSELVQWTGHPGEQIKVSNQPIIEMPLDDLLQLFHEELEKRERDQLQLLACVLNTLDGEKVEISKSHMVGFESGFSIKKYELPDHTLVLQLYPEGGQR